MIEGFEHSFVQTNDIRLSMHRAGRGTPIILLHGYPQNHRCWELIAPELAKTHDVIVPDLRGYGASDAPENDPDNTTYSKRTMAQDIAALMDALGIDQAHILGHDRGARVAYRFALDHPDRLLKLGIIEIVPTGDFWANWSADLGMAAYHWTFLAQPYPMPERMINADPDAYFKDTLTRWTLAKSLEVFSPDALESYLTQARNPARVHAMCSDYRAGATFDRALDNADKASGAKIKAPLRFLFADDGFPAKSGDAAGYWKDWCDDVTASSCASGHFVMEENPKAVASSFIFMTFTKKW